jgi:DNA-binding SARP family transcriptional activator
MSLSIQLLGAPRLERDGAPADPPRGRKAWALLVYLALTERAPARRELAELLFSDADDPLGALRWSLSALRRAIAPEGTIEGDPVRLDLRDATLDLEVLLSSPLLEPSAADRLSAEMLDGIELSGAPAFESWLLVERRRLSAAAEGVLHEGALARLAAGETGDAVAMARRATTLNPLEEGNQELLVRCLAASGDREGARAQTEACEALFREELGVDPSPAVRRAADSVTPFGGRSEARPAAARGLLEAGRAAIAAGATEAGLTSLREASEQAARTRDPALRAEALTALGIALVHAVRGWDGEGAASLHRALVLAEETDAREIAVTAHRELGWVGFMVGRHEQAVPHLERALELAERDDEIAGVLGVWGSNSTDVADYPRALAQLGESVERAERAGDRSQVAYSEAMVARVRLLQGDLEEARARSDRAIATAGEENWLAFVPFPEAIRAEADRLGGDLAGAGERFERAFALGCSLEDPCWESMAARGLGLIAAEEGDSGEAARWLEEARTRCVRWPDRWEWSHGYALEAAAGFAVSREDPRAPELVARLRQVADHASLREQTVRALLLQARLGDAGARPTAELIAREIDNPALSAELQAASV